MFSSNININTLRENLNFDNVPGWPAQAMMAPPYRQNLMDKAMLNSVKPKLAAILIIIYEDKNELFFPLIHRNTYPGVHSNQIGFPGGKVEKTDASLKATAIRESFEEIHALPKNIEVLGKLTELYIPPSNFIVHPFVSIYTDQPKFKPSDLEVKKIIKLPLLKFVTNPPIKEFKIETNKHKQHLVPGFQLANEIPVWGATAMMLNEFLVLIKNSLNLS